MKSGPSAWSLGAFGVGALTGSMLAVIAVRRFTAVLLTTVGKVIQGLLFSLLLLPLSPAGLAACLLLAGLFNGITNGPAAAVRLTRISAGLRPQTLTIFSAITTLGGAGGLVLGGVALEALGERATLLGRVVTQVLGFSLFVVGFSAVSGLRSGRVSLLFEARWSALSP